MSTIGRRLADLERRRAPLRPPGPKLAWLSWLTHSDLDWAEEALRAERYDGRALTELDLLRFIEIEAAALRRQLRGEPPAC